MGLLVGVSEGGIDGRALTDYHGRVILGLPAQRGQPGIERFAQLTYERRQGLQRRALCLLLCYGLH